MKEQIDIFDDLLIEFDEMGFVPTNFLPDHDSEYYAIDWRNRLINALEGYRKQSKDMVDIATIKKWLYQIAINNVGYVLDGDFSNACEEIISRLDGLKRFAQETKGGAE